MWHTTKRRVIVEPAGRFEKNESNWPGDEFGGGDEKFESEKERSPVEERKRISARPGEAIGSIRVNGMLECLGRSRAPRVGCRGRAGEVSTARSRAPRSESAGRKSLYPYIRRSTRSRAIQGSYGLARSPLCRSAHTRVRANQIAIGNNLSTAFYNDFLRLLVNIKKKTRNDR